MVVDIGSRGPMIGVFAASVLPVAVGFKSETVRQVRSWKGLVAAGVVLALVVGGVYWYRHVYGMFPTGITRMLRIGKAIAGETNDKRVQLMGAAVRGWLQRPLLGHGCGAFPLLWGGWDAKAHPHNMVLEILVELGIVGLGLFGVLCSMAYGLLGSLSRLQREPWRMLVLMLLVMLFMHAMVSCDLHENRALFMVLGMFSLGAAKPFAGD